MNEKKGLIVFIVDDNAVALESLAADLRQFEQVSDVYTYSSYAEATLPMLEIHPDVLFLDVEVPGKSGLEFLQSVRQHINFSFKVVFYSAFSDYMIDAIRQAAFDFLLKPYKQSELRTVVEYLPAFGVPEENFEIDLTIARGLDYYTGTVYETVMTDHPEVGSVCSGGRYDNLAEYYTNKNLPGVGISIGLTRLFYVLQEQNMLSENLLTAPADVLILPMTDDLSGAIALATKLRAAGLRAQIYGEKKKFKAKMAYADKLGIPFVIFLGEDEIAQGKCSVKNMTTGEQQTVTSNEALLMLRVAIDERNAVSVIQE